MPPQNVPSLKNIQSSLIALASVTGILAIVAWLSILWLTIPENDNILSWFLIGASIYAPYVTGAFAVMYYIRFRQLRRGLSTPYRPLFTRGVTQIIAALPPVIAGSGLIVYIVYVLSIVDGSPGGEFVVFIAGFIGMLTLPVLLFGVVLLIIGILTLKKSRKTNS